MAAPAYLSISSSFTIMDLMKTGSAASAVSRVYPQDPLKKILHTTSPSMADRWAHSGKEIASKSFVELLSGRVVETLTFKDQSIQCIGSFSSVAQEGCQEGFAVCDQTTDAQWCQLVLTLLDEKVKETEDWSCGWNSMQNALYLQTGMKCTFLEMLQFFVSQLNTKTEQLVSKLAKVKTDEDLKQFSEREGLFEHGMHIHSLFDAEPLLMTLSTFTHQIFFQAIGTQHKSDLFEGKTFSGLELVTEQELIQKVKNHPFMKEGPLLFTADGVGLLLLENQDRKLVVVDPYNLQRDSLFSTLRYVQDWEVFELEVNLRTQDINGKAVVYSRVENVTGLHRDIKYGPLSAFLADIRNRDPLGVDELGELLVKLRADMNAFNATFRKVNADLNSKGDQRYGV